MGLDVFASHRACRPGDESASFEPNFSSNLAGVVRSVGAAATRDDGPPVGGTSPPRDWDALIAQARTAAQRTSETEMRLWQRELQARNLLRSAHKRLDEAALRMSEADERVRAAETRAQVAEARAAAMIEAAERRATRAEAAARSALDWLQRLRKAELPDAPGRPAADPFPRALRRVA